jgi:hypothetical protein
MTTRQPNLIPTGRVTAKVTRPTHIRERNAMTSTDIATSTSSSSLIVAVDLHAYATVLADYQTEIARLREEIAERDADIVDLTRQLARYRRGARHALLIQRHRVEVLLHRLRERRLGAAA